MSGASRPLQPAMAFASASDASRASDSTSPGPNRPTGSRRQKRTLIESACSACRRRKSRCDGVRPSCSRCSNLRTDCQYEAEEGESRWSALRRRNQILEAERDQLRELVSIIQGRSESEALEIFHHMRTASSDDFSTLLLQVRGNTSSSPKQLPSQHLPNATVSDQQRLPPIQAILDVTTRPRPSPTGHPPSLLPTMSTSSEDSRSSSTSIPLAKGRAVLETLEPAVHHLPPLPQLPTLSSEESSGSVGAISHDTRSYHIPT